MKKLLFLTTALVAQATLSAIDKPQVLALADTAYKLYLGSVLQAGKIPKVMGFVSEYDKLMILRGSPEVKELKATLDASFAANNPTEGKEIAELVIVFARALHTKLGNAEQLVEVLQLLGLKRAYFYTLETLTKEQQEIIYFAMQLTGKDSQIQGLFR